MDRVTMKIPRQLYLALKPVATSTGFSSVNELIVFVMRVVAIEEPADGSRQKTKRQAAALRRRLGRLTVPARISRKNRKPKT